MSVITSPEIWHRDDFAALCLWRRLVRCVEIGVDRADFARCFLSRHWNCAVYMAVDPYEPYDEMPWDREADFLMAVQRLEPHVAVAKIVRMKSVDFCDRVTRSESLHYRREYDFGYVDGEHTYFAVARDLQALWPLISDHGIMAGHDFDGDHPDVQRAVVEFANEHSLDVFITQDKPASWYLYKSGPPAVDWRRVGDGETF